MFWQPSSEHISKEQYCASLDVDPAELLRKPALPLYIPPELLVGYVYIIVCVCVWGVVDSPLFHGLKRMMADFKKY